MEACQWPSGDEAIAGVSALSLGGLNAHAVLAAADRYAPEGDDDGELRILPVSGHSEAALREQVQVYAELLEQHPTLSLPGICCAAEHNDRHLGRR